MIRADHTGPVPNWSPRTNFKTNFDLKSSGETNINKNNVRTNQWHRQQLVVKPANKPEAKNITNRNNTNETKPIAKPANKPEAKTKPMATALTIPTYVFSM